MIAQAIRHFLTVRTLIGAPARLFLINLPGTDPG